MLDLKKVLVLLSVCISSLTHLSHGEPINLTIQEWRFKLDNSLSVKDAVSSSKGSWETILLGDYWQNLGFPNTKNTKHPLIGWYSCRFKISNEMKKEKLFIRIGAIDDLDKAYVNGHLIGETNEDTPGFWSALRLYPIPSDILSHNSENELLIRVEDLRGNGGITTAPFEIIPESMIPKVNNEMNSLGFRMDSLEFTIEYSSKEEADTAKLAKQPLPYGKEWAFTMRWDDNTQKNFRMHELMSKYGFKGGFYLYSNYRFNPKGMNYGAKEAKILSQNGSVIGAHSMTHPNMPRLTKNEMFYEAAAIRVEREKDADNPVVAYVFPGGGYHSNIMTSAWSDIGETLARCGYHHNLYSHFVNSQQGISSRAVSTVQVIAPGDKKASPSVFDEQLSRILKNKKLQKENPNLTWGIHVWMDEEGWKNVEKIMQKYRGRNDWWFCSPNDYAAYRYLYLNSKLEKVSQEGSRVKYKLTYPLNADLGANIPLNVKVENGTIANLSAKQGSIKQNNQIVEISQPVENSTPKLIDAYENVNNLSDIQTEDLSKFPGVKANLFYDKKAESLKLKINNDGNKALSNISLKLWLPLRYNDTKEWIKIDNLNPQSSMSKTITLTIKNHSKVYDEGRAYFVAQIDCIYNNSPARIYATTREIKTTSIAQKELRDSAKILYPTESVPNIDFKEVSGRDYKPKMLGRDDSFGWIANPCDPQKWAGSIINLRPTYAYRKWHKSWTEKVNSATAQTAIMIDFSLEKNDTVFLKSSTEISEVYLSGQKTDSNHIIKVDKGTSRLLVVFNVRKMFTQINLKLNTRDSKISYK